MVLLEGKNLTKKYKNRERETDALRDISFYLKEKEFLGIVGESGSGKSTLLRLIAGLERPDSGVLTYRGDEYQNRKAGYAGQFLQMIFQDAYGSFDPRLRMGNQMEEVRRKNRRDLASNPGRLAGTMTENIGKTVASAELRELSERTGILTKSNEKSGASAELRELLKETLLEENLLEKRPRELSGGQCQRMSIVRALYSGAEIILCDEMTSALDVTAQAQIVRIFGRLREMRSFSSIIVSHDIALVNAMCDRIMVMKDGRIVEEGKTSEVIRNPKDEYTKQLIMSAREQGL
ncbi:MAG: ABC transporter ATP-binding protein [Lachnospiraceae bacterium]|nr:ABC transporter ATP-binding protein [Lachnospiraceae bacterium]